MSNPAGKNLQHTKTLVLNADYMPIGIVHWSKAIGMVHVKETAILVDSYLDTLVDSKGNEYELPAVIALKDMVIKHCKKVPFNRKNVMLRDKLCCCYCGGKFLPKDLTYDHVIPRSKWKLGVPESLGHTTCTNWDNIVSACRACNTKKANKTLEESGMKLLRKPRKPTRSEISMRISVYDRIPKEWSPYMTSINNLASM